jgi:PAS domain S-box-containing protein
MNKSPSDTSPNGSPLSADEANAWRILETAPAIIYVYDVAKGEVVFQNRRLAAQLGYEEGSAPAEGNEWRRLLHPDDARHLAGYDDRIRKILPDETLSWEFRVRHANGEWRWFASHDRLLTSNPDGSPRFTVGSASDVTLQKQANEHKELLLNEMQHRTRNLTAVIDAIARQSIPKNQPAVEQYYKAIIARLRALFAAAEIVMSSQRRVADLERILDVALAPFRDETSAGRIALNGPPVSMPEETAASLALAVHELATNAMKYGALSQPAGNVALTWQVSSKDGPARIDISWKERGGPRVKVPSHEGFGARVIRYAAARQKDGRVNLDYEADGVSCKIGFELPA